MALAVLRPNVVLNPDNQSGPFTLYAFYRAAQFPDGLSNTVGISERIQGDWLSDVVSKGDYLLADHHIGAIDGRERGRYMIEKCAAEASNFSWESRGGECWMYAGFHFTNYNHCLPPNPKTPDCAFDPAKEGLHNRLIHSGSFPARSRHPGGVNVAAMDGSVRFVRDTIEREVWQALGTRNGREIINADAW